MIGARAVKLGLFASMSTGEGREVPFFSDTLSLLGFRWIPLFYEYLMSATQPSKLPPSPQDYVGTYSAVSALLPWMKCVQG